MSRVPIRASHRNDPISFLVEQRFPAYRAALVPPTLGHHHRTSTSLTNERLREIKAMAEAYRQELLALSRQDLLDRAAQEEEKMDREAATAAAQREAQLPWNNASSRPDYAHWARMPFWSWEEGLALTLGRNPKALDRKKMLECVQVSPFVRKYEAQREVVQRAVTARLIGSTSYPNDFLSWAMTGLAEVPAELVEAVSNRGRIETIDSLRAERDGLREELQAVRAVAAARPADGWPWGGHHTRALGLLRGAAEKFWINYDPTDPSTAPTNAQVKAWLVEQGASDRIAENMASILRADGLPPGPRK